MRRILLLFILFTGCKSTADLNVNTFNFKVQCLGDELDGSITLMAWGNGRNRKDALEQARKNAVNELLFNGIYHGEGNCNTRPLVNEVNAREKYFKYFDDFFQDNGKYLSYISGNDEKIIRKFIRKKMNSSYGVSYYCVVRIQKNKLRESLINDQILKL